LPKLMTANGSCMYVPITCLLLQHGNKLGEGGGKTPTYTYPLPIREIVRRRFREAGAGGESDAHYDSRDDVSVNTNSQKPLHFRIAQF